jgi:hypothetical protein
MASVFEEWKSYRQRVIPPTAPEVQVIESKRAFYGGAFSLFALLQRIASPGDEVTEADMNAMSNLDTEFKEFYRRMEAGKE